MYSMFGSLSGPTQSDAVPRIAPLTSGLYIQRIHFLHARWSKSENIELETETSALIIFTNQTP